MEDSNLIIFIVAVTAIVVLTIFFNRRGNIPPPPPIRESISSVDGEEFSAPTSEPTDDQFTYVYYPDKGVYLIPYYELDWSIPYHRWMYLQYPGFYYDYFGVPVVYDVDYHYHHWWNCRHGLCDWPWHTWWYPWWWDGSSRGTSDGLPLQRPSGPIKRKTTGSLPKANQRGYTPKQRQHPQSKSPKPSKEKFIELDPKTGKCRYAILDPSAYDDTPAYAGATQENFIQLDPKTGECRYAIEEPAGYDDINAFASADPKKDLLF